MAWGISPRKIAVIPLGDYNADHYLTLLYHAFVSIDWRISYFDRDGIIAYTNISWESYAEEVSVRIINNEAIIKSECVGYQFFFTDYGKNQKNLELLYSELEYVEYHLQHNLKEAAQELMDSVPANQFISLDNPPMGAKETLRTFLSAFTPTKSYFVTPVLVLVNIVVFFVTRAIMTVMLVILITTAFKSGHHGNPVSNMVHGVQNIYLSLGFSSRSQVLNGQVWRLLTNTFLHFSMIHIAGNMIVLIYIGSLLESKLGRWNYLFLYLLTGICASITSVMWNDQGIAAGASGAIFGLFGILLALLSTDFYESNARRALLISTCIFVGINIIPLGHHIDHAAHLGGLVSGYVLGWMAYCGIKYQKQSLITVGALAITLVLTGLCMRFTPDYNFKEAEQLTHKNEKILQSLNKDFYWRNRELSHADRLALLENNDLPKLKTLNDIAQKLSSIKLPGKQKKIATIQSKIIVQESTLFSLLYKEMRDQDETKYRPTINSVTDTINKLRREWGDLEYNGNSK